MRRVLRIVGSIVVLLVLVIAGFVLRTMHDAGAFKTIEPHFDGEARLVRGAVGPEDITIDYGTGIAYVSACDRWAFFGGNPVPGGIYAYDLNDSEAGLRNLTPDADATFQPHGISLWHGPDGRKALFVVNHPRFSPPEDAIEIFDLVDGALVHRRTIADDPHLVMPNDLLAVGPEQFYVTNTHANPPGVRQTIETYLRLRGARVVYFDGDRFHVAIDDLVLPNGINVSADGRTVYVASTTGRTIHVYGREPATGTLTFHRDIFIGTGLDNIEVAPDGPLWLGTHPNLLLLPRYMDAKIDRTPSQVIRLDPNSGRVEELFLDDGVVIAASSVAAPYGNRFLIGQIFADGILDCTLSASTTARKP